MSDLSLRLQQAASQLPVSSYFDEALYQREMQRIFQGGPRYVGHSLSVPNLGDYYALPQEAQGRALLRTPKGVELISNVCRHRQALMLKGRGTLGPNTGGNIVCPLHRWTYNASGPADTGTLLGAPHFEQDPCLNLNNYKLREWNGLLFEDNGRDIAADLAGMGPRAELDFSGYVLDHVEMHECNYNWKTFIEVYLEDYHVGPFHPGLGQFVSCEDLRWEFSQNYSVQTVGVANRLGKAGSPVYERWQKALLQYRNGEPPKYGAIWLTYYPHIMVEWYPHVLTVSTLHPMGPNKTMNMVEFFYPEEIAAFEREFVEAQQAAYMETCIEDDEIGERMDEGRRALLLRGDNEVGPYQSPMEDGMQQFHEWYRAQVGADSLQF
ncbi:MAG: aromatic ring-hydroxylating dioxygenase subunit alpha [Gammaproteobacteria bacterium]|jgi:phenylpropionate dioxygenase-like ring-hydroxylating dioxygenase large terminal subunit|nr:aromatic ring-hydroxylating dioxygenase subunit alpha [Gammaproteobacteria bacterium]MBU0788455.1 aromatic ring-hydroxylating dioxygenase subunit alpha [Gammaproteobacteria bacterium]MBU0816434.1 aromatic ring-hydroxylating dioxygenase subunit alpha [Gammaproteobacteria bacterium]MBU1788071.1 aromatic ring-hydroxylating dioxygenase subunit alpha [Gammaproteobacteria bacterium]